MSYYGAKRMLLNAKPWPRRRWRRPDMLATLTVIVGMLLPAGSQAAAQDPEVRNFLQVTPDFCTGGQPRMEHFAELKSKGVKAVLNLRTPGEHRAEEEKSTVEQAGLKYFNIPVVYREPSDVQVDEFLKITDDPANRPMFIHCTAAIRVGAFWLIRRVVRDGMSWEAALEEARKVGLVNAPHLEEFAKRYITSHPAKR
jgi:uncharacterized protein (TIGR01244 family)